MSGMAAMLRSGAGDRVGSAQSPTLLSRVQSRLSSPMRSPGNTSNRILNNESSYYEDKPQMHVSIVLEHLWTEPVAPSGQSKESRDRASKVFRATDLVSQSMICLVRSGPTPGLQLVKMETVNDNSDKIIFGAAKKIPALDAVHIAGLNMILVLDMTGSLVLYSGSTRVSKIMLPSSPTTILSQVSVPYSSPCLS